jgi:hypothetical protein
MQPQGWQSRWLRQVRQRQRNPLMKPRVPLQVQKLVLVVRVWRSWRILVSEPWAAEHKRNQQSALVHDLFTRRNVGCMLTFETMLTRKSFSLMLHSWIVLPSSNTLPEKMIFWFSTGCPFESLIFCFTTAT